jgi:thiol-disulfide isomerase/thioredoxin
MTKLRFLFLFAIILHLPFISKGQFSRDQAKALVLDQILVADTGHINVYSSYDTISSEDSLVLIDNRKITLPYAYNWVFLSDDDPFAYWCHPCRYVIVNSSNGDYTIDSADIYPVDFKTGYEIILQIPVPPAPPSIIHPCDPISPTYATLNSHLHAVLICGDDQKSMSIDIA